MDDFLLLIDFLIKNFGYNISNIYSICDPSLKYYIDKPEEFQVLIEEGIIIEAPKVADEMILGFALKHDFCFIISNDKFREYLDQLPNKEWLRDRRISFMFAGDEVCLSPNIDYERILQRSINITKVKKSVHKTTLEVINYIEQTKGEFDLF